MASPAIQRDLCILLVDDSAEFLASATALLAEEHGLAVVGTAQSGQEALALAARLYPDLVLMDLAMPGMTGLEAASRIKREPAAPRVVVLTLYDTPQYRAAAARCADGYLSKHEFAAELMPLIDRLFPDRREKDEDHGQ